MDEHALLAMMLAASFAAGVNVYATAGTLGLLARFGVVTLPAPLAVLSDWWVLGACLLLFAIEFVADKIPLFDLVWNGLQTFVRVPAGAMLAWSASAPGSPGMQMGIALLGALVALAAHGGKLALRGAVSASPEPMSNILLSAAEDVVAIGLTWFASEHPYLAAAVAGVLIITIVFTVRLAWAALRAGARRVRRLA